MKCPCQHCTERYVGCHSKCDKYKAFKEELAKIRDAASPKGKGDIMQYKSDTYERYARYIRNTRGKRG